MGTDAGTTRTFASEHDVWSIWRSDAGRWWATRAHRFPEPAEEAGAMRTVDADDADELVELIKAQEAKVAD